MPLEKVYDYFHNYDKQTYQVVACMGSEPSEQDIKDFENQYGINLPADFREFTMSPLGGLYMEVREEKWSQAKQYDIGPFWSFCRGIIVYGIANGIPDFLDIREKTKELHDEGFTDFIPFLSIIGNGDEIFCFDKNNNIIAELEERKNKKIRKGFKNLNRKVMMTAKLMIRNIHINLWSEEKMILRISMKLSGISWIWQKNMTGSMMVGVVLL